MLDANLYFLWPDVMTNFTFLDPEIEKIPYLDHSVFLRRTKDGWIAAMPVQQAEMVGAFRALEVEYLIDDERFNTFEARTRNRGLLRQLMDDAYAAFTTDELVARMETYDVPYSRVNMRDEVTQDPQIEAMQALWTYDHPAAGEVRSPRPPAQFERTPSSVRASHTPALGEHNGDVLLELGFDQQAITQLYADGVLYADAATDTSDTPSP